MRVKEEEGAQKTKLVGERNEKASASQTHHENPLARVPRNAGC